MENNDQTQNQQRIKNKNMIFTTKGNRIKNKKA